MKTKLKIDWCTHKAARYAVMHWHYSKAMPSGKLVKFGVWENDRFIGSIIYGGGATPEIGSPFGVKQTEICELVRVALNKHINPVSRMIAISLKILKKQNPRIRLVVSFADSSQGHKGGIYKAGNWYYFGEKEYHAYKVLGRVVHPKTLHARFGTGGQSINWLRQNVDPKAQRIKNGIKYKFVYPLDESIRNIIEEQQKRVTGVVATQSPIPVIEGGAEPTVTLQLNPTIKENQHGKAR